MQNALQSRLITRCPPLPRSLPSLTLGAPCKENTSLVLASALLMTKRNVDCLALLSSPCHDGGMDFVYVGPKSIKRAPCRGCGPGLQCRQYARPRTNKTTWIAPRAYNNFQLGEEFLIMSEMIFPYTMDHTMPIMVNGSTNTRRTVFMHSHQVAATVKSACCIEQRVTGRLQLTHMVVLLPATKFWSYFSPTLSAQPTPLKICLRSARCSTNI